MHRPLTVAALTLGLLAAGAGPAAAKPFDLWTAAAYSPGKAHAYGEIELHSYGVTVTGRLNDVCPADGHGAYLKAIAALDNGAKRTVAAKDTTTCKNAQGVDVNLHITVPDGRTIRHVRLHLYEYDAERNAIADTADKRFTP